MLDEAVLAPAPADRQSDAQILHECDGKFFVGVNYCAMDKYREPCSPEQWKNCVDSIKVRSDGQARACAQQLAEATRWLWQEVADVAADYGIEYGLEVVNRYETNIANTGVQVGSGVAGPSAEAGAQAACVCRRWSWSMTSTSPTCSCTWTRTT